MPFGVSSGIPNVIMHAKFHVDWLRGFWAAGPPKVSFPILIGTTLTTVLHYRADCDYDDGQSHSFLYTQKALEQVRSPLLHSLHNVADCGDSV